MPAPWRFRAGIGTDRCEQAANFFSAVKDGIGDDGDDSKPQPAESAGLLRLACRSIRRTLRVSSTPTIGGSRDDPQ